MQAIQNVLYVRPRVRAHRVIAQTVLRRAAAVHGLVARAGVQIAPDRRHSVCAHPLSVAGQEQAWHR
jgi:hypothetical protein